MKRHSIRLLAFLLSALILITAMSACDLSVLLGSETTAKKEKESTTKRPHVTREVVTDEPTEEPTEAPTQEYTFVPTFPALEPPIICNWYHNANSVVNFTFDDGYDLATAEYVNSIMKPYGYHATAMLSVCFADPNVTAWRRVLEEGVFTVACHGWQHADLTGKSSENDPTLVKEIGDAQAKLRELFPGQRVLTYASPGAHTDKISQSAISKYYLANRDAGIESLSAVTTFGSKMYSLGVVLIARPTMTGSEYNQAAKYALEKQGGWAIELFHDLSDNPVNSITGTKEAFADHVKWIHDTYGEKVWVASFEETVLYHLERKAATATSVRDSVNTVTVTLTDTLDDEIYDQPLTLRVNAPEGWKEVTYIDANGNEVTATAFNYRSEMYFEIDMIPDSDPVILTKSK